MSDPKKARHGAPQCALILAIAFLAASVPRSAQCQTAGEIERLQEEISTRDALIEKLVTRVDELEGRMEQIEARDMHAVTPAAAVEVPTGEDTRVMEPQSQPEAAPQSLTAELDEPAGEEQNRLIRSAFEQTLIDRGGLLLQPRTFNIDPSFSYVHSSAENVVIDGFTVFPVLVIGDIVSERVDRDLFLGAVTFRFGLPWDSQLEARVPFGRERLRVFSADGGSSSFSDSGGGDVSLSMSHQIFRGRETWPDVLVSAGINFDSGTNPFEADEDEIFTGSGYRSANLSLTGVKVVDPVVYFWGLSYTYNDSTEQNFETRTGDPVRRRFSAGDTWGFNIGMAIALNFNSSLSFAYDQQFTAKSKLDGEAIPGSYATTGVFSIGSTYSFTDRITADFKVGIGVTQDSPDLIFSISFPLRGQF